MKYLITTILIVGGLNAFGLLKNNSPTHKPSNSSIDSCQFWHHKYDSAKVTAIMSEARLGQVRYYMKIVNRKPSQQKFLRGWINRALK